jgi:hypothetical protein
VRQEFDTGVDFLFLFFTLQYFDTPSPQGTPFLYFSFFRSFVKMFSRSFVLVFLAMSLCVQAAPHSSPGQCDAISTVIQTVTVTAHASAATGGKTDSEGSRVRVADGSAASAISSASTAHVGDKNGGQTSSSTASVATATEGHGGGSNTSGRNGSTKTSASSTNIASTLAITNSTTSVDNNTGNNNASDPQTNSTTSVDSNAGNNNSSDSQTSLTLVSSVIATGFAKSGQDVPSPGQVKSLTSDNNFINFCLTVPNLNITNGKQIAAGSCNPAPMGIIPSTDNMPSSKFTFPKNFGTLQANQTFNITMAINNLHTGFFTNPQENYLAAPQHLDDQGRVIGHSHFVIEQLSSLGQTTPTNPKTFVFFKGVNVPAVSGTLTETVSNGLSAGFYKLSSMNAAENHQPVLVPIAQHGSLDDVVYFSVTSDGVPASNGTIGESAALTTSAGNSVTTPPPPVLSSATVVPASATLVPGTNNGKGLASTSSFIPASTSLVSTKGKRELRNRFALKN